MQFLGHAGKRFQSVQFSLRVNFVARIGIFCRDLSVTGAEAKVIEAIVADERHQVSIVVNLLDGGYGPRVRPASLARQGFAALAEIEAKITRRYSSAPYADRVVQIPAILPETPCLEVSTIPCGEMNAHKVLCGDCKNIRAYNCDVMLNFGFADLEFDGPAPAELGVLTLDHTAGPNLIPALEGFWQWYDGAPYTESVVWCQDGHSDRRVLLNRARYSTYRLSWSENRRRILDRARYLLLDAIEAQINDVGNDRHPSLAAYDGAGRGVPGFVQLAVACCTYLYRFIRRNVLRLLWKDQWGIALGEFNPNYFRLKNFRRVFFPPKDRFWADPFLITDGGKEYVFVEELIYGNSVGTINCLVIEKNEIRSNNVVIEEPFHLSYPYIFSYDDGYYMCPEMSQNRKIEIFKCTEFPLRWERYVTLMENIHASDVSLHTVNGKWWLFANLPRNSFNESCNELHLFSAEDPFSKSWVPHPCNPIVRDAAMARGGGGVCAADGRLYRIAQGLDRYEYGSNLVINEILEINEDRYVERTVQKVYPDWMPGITGVHHFARWKRTAVVDMKRRIARFG